MPRAKLKAQLVLCNVPTQNSEAARRFYGSLLGSDDFVRALNDQVESYFRPLSPDGIDMTITQRYEDEERLTCYFAVESLDATLKELEALGGKIVVQPRDVPIGPKRAFEFYSGQMRRLGVKVRKNVVGRMAVLLDPDGNHVGVMQLEAHAHPHFRLGEFQRPLDPDQVGGLEEARQAAAE